MDSHRLNQNSRADREPGDSMCHAGARTRAVVEAHDQSDVGGERAGAEQQEEEPRAGGRALFAHRNCVQVSLAVL